MNVTDIISQIGIMCNESENSWFLTHSFTEMALHDLRRKDDENYEETRDWEICDIIRAGRDNSYVYEYIKDAHRKGEDYYEKSQWIFPEFIDGELPGFILLQIDSPDETPDGITHQIYFAFVKRKFRKQGILKSMMAQIPKETNIWLQASSNEIRKVEKVWEKVGFTYVKTINEQIMCSRLNV